MTDINYLRGSGKIIIIILLILLSTGPLASWEYSEFSIDLEGRVAMMAAAGKWNPYVEIKGVYHGLESRFRYNSLSVGSYFRVAPWMKIGAFYRLQGGARHIEDWQVFDLSPAPGDDGHYFDDTKGRYESLVYLDATPRFLLPWMPGKNWVTPLKVRYFYNFYNNHQTLLLRPGLSYVIMSNRKPLVNLSLNYNLYFALNFGETALYAQGPYLTVLGHINEWFKLEGRVNYLVKTYSKWDSGSLWTLRSRHLLIGIGAIFTPDFSPRI